MVCPLTAYALTACFILQICIIKHAVNAYAVSGHTINDKEKAIKLVLFIGLSQ